MKGVFSLNNSVDLFKKLEWEFDQLVAKPTNAYLAYNFFVTAWHLLEWQYPDRSERLIRNNIRKQTPLLQICEHLAVSAKHFEAKSQHLNAVSVSKKSSCWSDDAWAPGTWAEDTWDSWLVVELNGDAQKVYGNQIKVEELARLVMDYWRSSLR